MCKSTILRLIY